MTDEDARSPTSALRGRLADVYVPALVSGALDALSRRLGNRATIDDPLYGRASSLASIDPLLARVSEWLAQGKATYEHVGSTTGVDRDVAEGRVSMVVEGAPREVPIAVVAERRRLREIELRVYYAPTGRAKGRRARSALVSAGPQAPLSRVVASIVDGMRKGAIEAALAGFEEGARVVDAKGGVHAKQEGALATFLASNLSEIELVLGGAADDGRTSCIEATLGKKGREHVPALLSFERGDSGLVREMRAYWEE
ncbi:MAG: hypothetical protein JST00_46705 [Deltaproteobacteria bacterium]|nr:hypothetical protein [Deltaproteobacteria bacterium]